jgi:hypothetical protein
MGLKDWGGLIALFLAFWSFFQMIKILDSIVPRKKDTSYDDDREGWIIYPSLVVMLVVGWTARELLW